MSTLKHHVVAAMSKVDLASKVSPSLQAEYDERMSKMLDEHFAQMRPVANAINKGMATTTPQALADRADVLRREREIEQKAVEVLRVNAMPGGYSNPKVDALIAGHISLAPGTFTARDFIDLAIAALDQAGISVRTQRRVNELVQDEREGQGYITHDEQMEAGHA